MGMWDGLKDTGHFEMGSDWRSAESRQECLLCSCGGGSAAGNQTLGNTVGLGRVGVQLEEVGLRSNLRRFHFLLNLAYGPDVAVLNFSGSSVSGFCCPRKPYNIKIVQS